MGLLGVGLAHALHLRLGALRRAGRLLCELVLGRELLLEPHLGLEELRLRGDELVVGRGLAGAARRRRGRVNVLAVGRRRRQRRRLGRVGRAHPLPAGAFAAAIDALICSFSGCVGAADLFAALLVITPSALRGRALRLGGSWDVMKESARGVVVKSSC